jgi:hypothetical protein
VTRIINCLLSLLFFAVPSYAATYYASTMGSDSNSCTAAQSISTPKRTIQAGVDCLTNDSGDILYIRSGTYRETVNIVNLGGLNSGTRLLVSAYMAESVEITAASAGHDVLYLRDADYIDFQNLTIDGSNSNGRATVNALNDPQTVLNIRWYNIKVQNYESIAADPQFVDPGNGDFHIAAWSLAVHAGAVIPGITEDFDGLIRGPFPSVGAFEANGTPPAPIIAFVNPGQGNQSTTLNVVVTAMFAHFEQGTSVCSFSGTGITVNSTTVANVDTATCNITIAVDATLSARTVTVTTGAEMASKTNGFQVFGPKTPGVTPIFEPPIATPKVIPTPIGKD